MSPLRPLILLSGLAGLVAALPAAASDRPRMVVELFTSQGCSSCPPADKLLGDLASDGSVLALSMPVDYWDYLGWKDTLAERSFTERQKAYGDVRGDRQVYTPQAVIDGVTHAVGSDQEAIQKAEKAATEKGALSVPLSVEIVGGSVKVTVPAMPGAPSASVLLFPIVKKMEVAIGRGENKGKTISYNNVVRSVVPLGVWHGEARTYEVPVASLGKGAACDTYAAILQVGGPSKPGVILGAAKASGS
ncbi:MAG: DUF1223 domain-containing protein [Alsobacter sp.]